MGVSFTHQPFILRFGKAAFPILAALPVSFARLLGRVFCVICLPPVLPTPPLLVFLLGSRSGDSYEGRVLFTAAHFSSLILWGREGVGEGVVVARNRSVGYVIKLLRVPQIPAWLNFSLMVHRGVKVRGRGVTGWAVFLFWFSS